MLADYNRINDNKKYVYSIIAQGSHLNDDKHKHQNELCLDILTLCVKNK